MNLTKSKTAKFAAGVVGFAIALAFVVTPVTSSAQSTADLQAQIAGLLAQIAQLQASMGGGTMTVSVPVAPLTLGSTGGEVSKLQSWLINHGFSIPAGATGYFGAQTQAALAAFQAANGISPAVGYYGPITAAKLSSMGGSMTPGDNMPGPTVPGLQGGAGDITVTERSSGTEDEVLEGEEDVQVLGFEIEADGSDIAITSVRVEFEHDGSGSDRLNRYVDEVSIMMGNKVVGSADVDDFSESSDVYSRNIALSNVVIDEDEEERFYVAVSAVRNVDSDDLGQDWEVAIGQIRFQDATGAILSDTTGTGVNGTITETFSFEDLASSGDIELKVSEDDNDINESQTVEVDDSSDTNDVEILSFTLEAEGSDIFLDTMSFAVTSNSGTGVTEIANDFRLMMDGDEVGQARIDRDCDGGSDGFASHTDEAICVTIIDLDDDDAVIDEGDEVSFMLVADINDVDGGFSSGDTLSVTLNGDATLSDNGYINADDENGDALTASELSGSADSSNVEFLSTGVSVKTVSTNVSVDTKVSDVATDDQGIFEIVFDVTALGEDAWVETGVATRGTGENNTGVNFIIQDAPNSYAATTSGAIALSDVTVVTSGVTSSGDYVKVSDGKTVRFKLVVYFDPGNDHVTGSSIGYRMRLYSVNSAGTAIAADAQQVLTPEVDYRTGAISVGN